MEKGSDELLYETATTQEVAAGVVDEQEQLDEEEKRVAASEPASDEPGSDYPVADETPEGEAPDYDTNPPESP